jgi:hypothetical protein
VKRTLIQLDERTYRELRRRAYQRNRSTSAVVRETLAEAFGLSAPAPRRSIADFRSVAAGRSRQGRLAPVSDRHDEALAEALATRARRRRR